MLYYSVRLWLWILLIRRLPRRPPQKGNKRETLQDIARRVPVEIIRPYFNYPLRTAADVSMAPSALCGWVLPRPDVLAKKMTSPTF